MHLFRVRFHNERGRLGLIACGRLGGLEQIVEGVLDVAGCGVDPPLQKYTKTQEATRGQKSLERPFLEAPRAHGGPQATRRPEAPEDTRMKYNLTKTTHFDAKYEQRFHKT